MSAESGRIDELRRTFDSAFASEPAAPVERVDLIALRAAARSYAVRVSEIAGVVPFGGAVPLPCEEPAMLGIAAVRGTPLAVYDLAALVGDGPAKAPRWMLLSAGADRVALAFDELDGYLRIPRDQLVAAAPEHGAKATFRPVELARCGASLRPIVSVTAVVRELERRLGPPAGPPSKEK
jgi:chemotaxis signal transduction protein